MMNQQPESHERHSLMVRPFLATGVSDGRKYKWQLTVSGLRSFQT